MEKVEEQIPSWRIVVLCAEASTEPRLCARSLQYMLCMASSVRRGVSPATPLRTGSISRDAVSDGLRNRFFADAQNDNERVLRMTTNGCSEWQRKGAQDGNERVLRMTEYRG
ncbi:MAG: hypothetical protein IAC06_05755 [Bacteroidetes bacterium]|uniref:Uncharacterized protein n=1 Tax=Candidatus Cryptobacteroides intestinavium TaxID=2840766 RepID=A0A9D9HHV7_9BACT|nr:hypothetical protein [Candidatus Cryptobacteroides intestinavium]